MSGEPEGTAPLAAGGEVLRSDGRRGAAFPSGGPGGEARRPDGAPDGTLRPGSLRHDHARRDNLLGDYLRDRRSRLDAAALGFPGTRRRTPGLRREEVAQRANISPTWYTWLEQGRGGAPSAEVLNRIARGLMLTEAEREHLFILGLGHPPEVRYRPAGGVTPRLQRLLDALELSPAIVRTATWDVVAWNRAAAAVLTDYGALPAADRNILRLVFSNRPIQAAQEDWEATARFVVASFRAEATRAGAAVEIGALVEELCGTSADFARLWRDHDVRVHSDGTKRLRHATLGWIELEYSGFTVDGRPDLGMIVYNPATEEDARRIRTLLSGRATSNPERSPGHEDR